MITKFLETLYFLPPPKKKLKPNFSGNPDDEPCLLPDVGQGYAENDGEEYESENVRSSCPFPFEFPGEGVVRVPPLPSVILAANLRFYR